MASIAPTAQQNLLATLSQARSAQPAAETLQDRFLTLLVTQMRNQDPLNPLENAEVTTQLAQISTVSGIDKLNKAIEGMAQSFLAAQSVQASSLIGRGVLAPGNTLVLENGRAVAGARLTVPADHVYVTILGKAGERLETLDLGARPAGTLTFGWDGKPDGVNSVPDGVYTFEVEAVQGARKLEVERLGYGRVQSVTLGSEELQLDTYGLGPLGLSAVTQIL
jgi:flagellar basal-body rod modification protein FlgD